MRYIASTLLLLLFFSSTILPVDFRIERMEMMVANELQSSKYRPDVLIMKNGVFEIWSIPNRGRIVYRLSIDGKDMLYNNPYPMPYYDEDNGVYVLEFGGIYLSVPWNPRSEQPYNLEYEVNEKGKELILKVYGVNPTEGLFMETYASIRDMNNSIPFRTRVENISKKDKEFSFEIIAVFNFTGDLHVVSNLENLNGKVLKDFRDKTKIIVKAESGYIGVDNGGKRATLKFHGAEKVVFFTWGVNYSDHMGGAPYFLIRITFPSRSLRSGESVEYTYSLVTG